MRSPSLQPREMKLAKCRVCQGKTEPYLSESTQELDEPFLDAALQRRLPYLQLDQCRQCRSLWASDARQDQALLLDAYTRAPDSYFEDQSNDPRYMKFYQWLENLLSQHVDGGEILDVGCGDGAFMGALSQSWLKYGLEPSKTGTQKAIARGLQVFHGTLESSLEPQHVDVITALDVLEHIVDPNTFIESCKRRLSNQGLVMLVTGDIDSWTAKAAGPQWSYLRWCGHISVFSGFGLRNLLETHGFEILDWRRCNHPASPGVIAWLRVYALEPVRRILARNKSWYPFWRDHQVIVARLK